MVELDASDNPESLESFVGEPKFWEMKCQSDALTAGGPRANVFALIPDALIETVVERIADLPFDHQEYLFGFVQGQKLSVAGNDKGRLNRADLRYVLQGHEGYEKIGALRESLNRVQMDMDRLEFGRDRMVSRLRLYLRSRGQDEISGYTPFVLRMTHQSGFDDIPELSGLRGSDDSTLGFLTKIYGRGLFLACDNVEVLSVDESAPDLGKLVYAYGRVKDDTGESAWSDYAQKAILDSNTKSFRERPHGSP